MQVFYKASVITQLIHLHTYEFQTQSITTSLHEVLVSFNNGFVS